MKMQAVNAHDAPVAQSYSQACVAVGAPRLLHISGQIPLTVAGVLPADFREQCTMAWANVLAQLRAADMGVANLVKVTTFLSDRRHATKNRAVREEILGEHLPALTVIITGIFDEAWLVEIEAVAAAWESHGTRCLRRSISRGVRGSSRRSTTEHLATDCVNRRISPPRTPDRRR